MAETLFPTRQRCKACRSGLGLTAASPVFDGLYCSPACARIPALATDAAAAPRECKTEREGLWTFKRRYRCEEEIPDRLRQDPTTKWYRCSHCHHLHIGHTRMGEAEKFVMLPDRAALAGAMIKLRGAATHKEVGEAAKVRPIRVRELEQLTGPIDIDALFAVLGVYGVRLGFGLSERARRR